MAIASKTLWGEMLGRFRTDHPELVRGWFGDLRLVDLSGGVVTIEASSPAEKSYLQNECGRAFAGVAQAVLGRFITINVTLPTERHTSVQTRPVTPAQRTLFHEFTFATFVKAPSNDLAYAAAEAVVDAPGNAYNPLLIFGESGTGKTHLLQAICAELHRTTQGAQVVYARCRTFMKDYIEAFEHDELARFHNHYRGADLLAIDDVQHLTGNERSQEEFFHTFESIYKAGRQIVVAADRPPSKLSDLAQRITSRLAIGLLAPLELPSRETRRSILAARARFRCLDLTEGVTDLLADRFSNNTGDLIAGLDKIDGLARAQSTRIDLALARRALEEGCEAEIPVEAVLDAVCRRMEVDRASLLSRKRARRVAFARQIAVFLSRRHTRLSLEQVGKLFGGRDHVEVLETAQAMRDRIAEDQDLSALLDEIAEEAKNAPR